MPRRPARPGLPGGRRRFRRVRRAAVTGAAVVACAVALTASAAVQPPFHPTVAAGPGQAAADAMWKLPMGTTYLATPGMLPQVGVIASADGPISGFHCTGDVIASASGNRVLTAGHCTLGADDDDFVFVPGYHDGQAPYGVWRSTRVVRDPEWGEASHADQAFIEVAPLDGRTLTQAVGALPIAWDQPVDQPDAAMVGYPSGRDALQLCRNTTKRYAHSPDQDYLQMTCPDMWTGVSGGAWLIPPAPGSAAPGRVIGITGGVFDPFFGADVSTGLSMTGSTAKPFLTGAS